MSDKNVNICECVHWCSIDHRHVILTDHHENCPKGPKPFDKALELIAELARALELWGAQEDGIYDEAWPAYRKAKALEGVFLPDEPE